MPSSYNEIKVRMGFGSDIDPKEYQRRKYEFVFSPASIAMPIKRKYIRNFIANWLDGLSSSWYKYELSGKGKKMNYSTAVFLINPHIRAVVGQYENKETAPTVVYKTLDTSIKVGDYVIVPTNTRHNMTIVKITATDVDVDFDSNVQMTWVIGRVDKTAYEEVLVQEQTAIQAIKSAETRRKRDQLRDAMLKDYEEQIKFLPITTAGNDESATPAANS